MKKIAKRLHLWLALPAGLFVTLICATGAVLVFQTEISEALHPERYFVNDCSLGGRPRLSEDSLTARVNRHLVGDTVKFLKIDRDSSRNVVAALVSAPRTYAYVDPYSGQIVEIHNTRRGFFPAVMRLHRWLMLSNRTVGKMIVGVSTIFLVVIIATGLGRWWKGRKFTIKWHTANGFRRMLDLHSVLGAYVALFLLVMSLTGLMWSFGWYREGVAAIFGSYEMAQVMKAARAIHTGSWGGVATKIAWFVTALIGASLPVTGYVLYFRRKRREASACGRRGRSRGCGQSCGTRD